MFQSYGGLNQQINQLGDVNTYYATTPGRTDTDTHNIKPNVDQLNNLSCTT